jgi:hypothetical protein
LVSKENNTMRKPNVPNGLDVSVRERSCQVNTMNFSPNGACKRFDVEQ